VKTSYFRIQTNCGSIWTAYDYLENGAERTPLVIVAPAYEKTARDSLTIANYLVLNGFRVLRFDTRNSCGLSDGSIENFTMSSLVSDIGYVLEYAVAHLAGNCPLSIFTMSLSSRALIKYLSKKEDISNTIKVAISIVGVADLQYTISQIVNDDVFKGYFMGKKYGINKLLTYDVDYDTFLKDAVECKFHSIDTAIDDAKQIKIPYFGSIMVDQDEWILPEQQKAVHDALVNCTVEQYMINGASHKMWKNPRSAELALRHGVRIIMKYILGQDINVENVIKPDITEIVKINRLERTIILEEEKNLKEKRDILC